MAFSLLHALLMPTPYDKNEHWTDYQKLDPYRKALLMSALYDKLYTHISTNRNPQGGSIGTILARAMTQVAPGNRDVGGRDLQDHADNLRDSLRAEIVAYLNLIMS
jgi:hypothetical protein